MKAVSSAGLDEIDKDIFSKFPVTPLFQTDVKNAPMLQQIILFIICHNYRGRVTITIKRRPNVNTRQIKEIKT